MNKTNSRRPIHKFTDETGRSCVRVRLANSPLSAVLLAADLDRLAAAGLSCNWSLNSNANEGQAYVRTSVKSANTVVVARLIAGARWKQVVKYLNGDRLDLRLENLLLTKGGNAHKDCAAMLELQETQEVAP